MNSILINAAKMIRFPNTKINLGLSVLKRRQDGYHDIETVFYPVEVCDALEIIPSKEGKDIYHFSGDPIPGDPGTNLCVKAVELLRERYRIPFVELHLHKHIPMDAGLGGGSSDAAFCIKMLDELFELKIEEEILLQLAAELGSDCPFFILNKVAFASGRGEILNEIDLNLQDVFIKIVKPDVAISTSEAYRNIKAGTKKRDLREIIQNSPLISWKKNLVNDFEDYAFEQYPEIRLIRDILYDAGAVYAALSGSGAAVYGLFPEEDKTGLHFKNCFVWDGKLK